MVGTEKTIATLIGQPTAIAGELHNFTAKSTPATGTNSIVLSDKCDSAAVAVDTDDGTQLELGKAIYRGDAINVKRLITLAAAVEPVPFVKMLFADFAPLVVIITTNFLFFGTCQLQRMLVEHVANSLRQQRAPDMQLEIATNGCTRSKSQLISSCSSCTFDRR